MTRLDIACIYKSFDSPLPSSIFLLRMFITFEGIEGSGKSTQAKLLVDFLLKEGYRAALTREPGESLLDSLIRRVLLEDEFELDPLAELFLFCADRIQHVRDFIRPRLSSGEIVVCDRFTDSTVAYQGYGRELNMDFVKNVCDAAALGLEPDLTILLDCPVKVGLSRLTCRGKKTKIDTEPIEFHERIRGGYLKLAQKEPERIKVIDASKSDDKVWENVKRMVLLKLKAVSSV